MSRYRSNSDDIAIIGMSCRYAGVGTPSELWETVLRKRSHLGDHPDAMVAERIDPGVSLTDRPPRVRGGYLRERYAFDPGALGHPAAIPDGENADPLFAAQLAWEAIRDAGRTPGGLSADRTALLIGYSSPVNAGTVNWLQHTLIVDQTALIVQRFFPAATEADLAGVRQLLKDALPPIRADGIRGAHGHALAARAAALLGIGGACCVQDAGSVSALAAIRCAVDSLRARRCDLALAGAIQGPLTLPAILGLSTVLETTNRDSPVPLCRDADGTLFGEGGGMLVLRRKHEAERAGDRIYAIVRGIGIAAPAAQAGMQDGEPGATLARAVRCALSEAGSPPDTIDLFEAHGSGVPREDAAEIQALRDLCGDRVRNHPTVGVGSIKSSVGHVLTASGMAGMQKAALALYHRILPPSAQSDRPHPRLVHPRSPFYLLSEPRPWIRGQAQPPRRAGVNAMDFAGTCGHILMEAHPEAE